MALEPIPGQPGLFRDPEGADPNQIINIRDFREGDKYDTIAIPTGAIQLGTTFTFFQNLQGKNNGQQGALDTNIRTQSKLSAGESMILDRIGLYICSSTGVSFPAPQDFKTVADNAYYRLNINGLLQDEGPAVKFPSGYGLYGNTNESGQGIISIGVPATASAARLVKKQLLNQNHEIEGTLTFPQRAWLTQTTPPIFTAAGVVPVITVQAQTQTPSDAAVLVRNFLHGLLRVAVSK
jgi:hypothetical protein